MIARPRDQNVPGKIGLLATLVVKAAQWLTEEQVANYVSDFSWSRLDMEPAEPPEIAVDSEVFISEVCIKIVALRINQ